MTSPPRISDEDDFLHHLGKMYRLGEYGKVYQISTVKISPDIDIINIDNQINTVTAYELKLITFHKGWKRPDIRAMFTGFGQTLSYFQFGIDRSYLVLGLSKEIPKTGLSQVQDAITQFATIFKRLKSLLDFSRKSSFGQMGVIVDSMGSMSQLKTGLGCIGIKVWNENSNTLTTALEAMERFPIEMDKKIYGWHQCILRKEIKSKIKF